MIKYKKESAITLSAAVFLVSSKMTAAIKTTKNLKTAQIKLKSLMSNVTQKVMVEIPIQKLPASDYQVR